MVTSMRSMAFAIKAERPMILALCFNFMVNISSAFTSLQASVDAKPMTAHWHGNNIIANILEIPFNSS